MKKVIAAIMLVMLAGCGVYEIPSFWIKAAENACKDNAGLYSISYSENTAFQSHMVRCNDSTLKKLSQ